VVIANRKRFASIIAFVYKLASVIMRLSIYSPIPQCSTTLSPLLLPRTFSSSNPSDDDQDEPRHRFENLATLGSPFSCSPDPSDDDQDTLKMSSLSYKFDELISLLGLLLLDCSRGKESGNRS